MRGAKRRVGVMSGTPVAKSLGEGCATPCSAAATQSEQCMGPVADLSTGGAEEDWHCKMEEQERRRWQRAWFVGGRWFTTGKHGGTMLWCKHDDELRWAHVSGPADLFGASIRGQNFYREV